MATKTKTSDEAAAQRFVEMDPAKAKRFDRADLSSIENAVARRTQAQADIDTAVYAARERGIPWTAIGLALGVSHQAAMQRYKP